MTTKEKEIVKKYHNNDGWLDYYLKKFDSIVEIDDSHYFAIEKPSIKTSFCFGYGFCGVSTEEDRKRANYMARVADTNEKYFIDENMKKIKDLKKSIDNAKTFCLNNDAGELYTIEEDYFYRWPYSKPLIYRDVTQEEKKMMLGMVDAVAARFEKRLKTYLKRYGLSKINSWSYLVD